MKCRACWSDKAYVRPVKGWKRVALKCFSLVPLKCHHCYHKFSVPWLLTWGKQVTPPPLRVAEGTEAAVGARRRVVHGAHSVSHTHKNRKAA